MELSLFLAKLLGLYLVIVCLAALIQREKINAIIKQFEQSKELLGLLAGAAAILFGLLIVLTHNVWTPDWRSLITLLGYIGILKGVLRLFFIDAALRFAKKLLNSNGYFLVMAVFLAVGIYLTYVGFTGAV